MRGGKLPSTIIRNATTRSITLAHQNYKYSLIWLHGLPGQAEHYVSFFSHADSAVYSGCRIKLLQAPDRFVTINNSKCPSWYDIRSLKRFTLPEEEVFNFDDIRDSHDIISTHIEEQYAFWKQNYPQSKINPYQRIYVGGMSQGGVISLYYGLSADKMPAGVICLSGYLLRSTVLKNGNVPMLLVHGQRDTTIRQVDARKSYQKLLSNKQKVEYKSIKKLDHSVCLQQIALIKDWLQSNHNKIMSRQQFL